MASPRELYYAKRGEILVNNLKKRHFDAYYCANKEEALAKALELIPEGASVGWGGVMSAHEIGLVKALNEGNYDAIDRDACPTPEEKQKAMKHCLNADWFLTGANALSLDGEMVNIDGNGNRVACLIHGPEQVLVFVGMNKVVDDVESGIQRIGTHAAPPNAARLGLKTPCAAIGHCGDCHSPNCMCSQIVITRHSKYADRIKVILVGEELGF